MRSPYSMVIQWSDVDQVYVVTLPEFGPYAKTHGRTYVEAARNGSEVIELLLQDCPARGEPPVPLKFGSQICVPR
jgi:predicted RNase H-like HicB family nuclease